MKKRNGSLEGYGGVDIFWQAWLPDGEARAVVGLAHGASEHSGRYAWVGEQFARRGYALYALDHRGHGRSSGARAVIDSVDAAVADLGELLELAGADYLLGHSMGGWLSIAYATRRQDTIKGLLLSAPAADVRTASLPERIGSHLLSRVAPKLGVFTIDSGGVSRDPEVVRDYDNDPLNYHGKLPARTVHVMVQEAGRFPHSVPTIKLPLLVQVGTADPIVPPSASDFVYENASSDDKTIKRYEGLYHEILNEPEREEVVADTLDWLDQHA